MKIFLLFQLAFCYINQAVYLWYSCHLDILVDAVGPLVVRKENLPKHYAAFAWPAAVLILQYYTSWNFTSQRSKLENSVKTQTLYLNDVATQRKMFNTDWWRWNDVVEDSFFSMTLRKKGRWFSIIKLSPLKNLGGQMKNNSYSNWKVWHCVCGVCVCVCDVAKVLIFSFWLTATCHLPPQWPLNLSPVSSSLLTSLRPPPPLILSVNSSSSAFCCVIWYSIELILWLFTNPHPAVSYLLKYLICHTRASDEPLKYTNNHHWYCNIDIGNQRLHT